MKSQVWRLEVTYTDDHPPLKFPVVYTEAMLMEWMGSEVRKRKDVKLMRAMSEDGLVEVIRRRTRQGL